jgi:hypothetical protein
MPRQPVDLASHLNENVQRGHPADFPVSLAPVYRAVNGSYAVLPRRLAVVRQDTGEVLSVVSNRYRLVPHQRILDVVQQAIEGLDVGPVPRGVYVDRRGARMRAVYKFPALEQPVLKDDAVCPCLKIQNTYDGTSRIGVHIGAFRFVCTNLAVGGGGVFAGGFMSVHAGEIPIEKAAQQLGSYLLGFDKIVELYRRWTEERLARDSVKTLLEEMPKHAGRAMEREFERPSDLSVFEAYNIATYYATHRTRSYRSAFDLLERINRTFQERFPVSLN